MSNPYRTPEWIESILAGDELLPADLQRHERDEARRNLLAGMEIPPLMGRVIEVGGKICRFESPTEWEAAGPPSPAVRAKLMALMKQYGGEFKEYGGDTND